MTDTNHDRRAAVRQTALMFLRDKVINDAMPPVRKKIAGEWLLHRDRVLIDKLVQKHLPELERIIDAVCLAARYDEIQALLLQTGHSALTRRTLHERKEAIESVRAGLQGGTETS